MLSADDKCLWPSSTLESAAVLDPSYVYDLVHSRLPQRQLCMRSQSHDVSSALQHFTVQVNPPLGCTGGRAALLTARGQRAYAHWLVAVGGEVFSDQANDEATPQSSADAEEQVPVLDNTALVFSENTGELCWQSAQANCQHSLHTITTLRQLVHSSFITGLRRRTSWQRDLDSLSSRVATKSEH